ncbi:MAG: FAD-binding protein [Chloroflexi bacterium]|nr:FAD-binding protein [Chloroflexota bacterium]
MSSLDDLGRVICADLLVIGGGLGGLVASIKGRESGADVLVVDKGGIGWAGQVPLSGGRCMIVPPEDDLDAWVKWAVEGGEYLNNQDWAYAFGGDTHKCMMEIADWEMPFITDDKGQIEVIQRMRAYKAVQFKTDKFMLRLRRHAVRQGVRTLNKIEVVDLLQKDGRVVGAVGFDLIDGEFCIFKAKATIIANGSSRYKRQKLFNMNCGEGVAMAYRAGAEMINAEFSNTYGFTLKDYEVFTRDPIYYLFVNARGERVLEKHYPELAAGKEPGGEMQDYSKIVDAMAKEVKAGNGPIYFDISQARPEEMDMIRGKALKTERLGRALFMNPWTVTRAKGSIDMNADKVEFMPMFVGGQGPIRIGLECETTVEGLWAVGDASALGCAWSGARAPGSRPALGVPFAIVSGYRAGVSAGKAIADIPDPVVDASSAREAKEIAFAPMRRETGILPFDVVYRVHEVVVPLDYNFYRTAERLREGIAKIEAARDGLPEVKAGNPHELMKYHEAVGMANSAELTFRAALMRAESRGTHRRLDFPARDDANWLCWIVQKRAGDEIQMYTEPVPVERFRYRP